MRSEFREFRKMNHLSPFIMSRFILITIGCALGLLSSYVFCVVKHEGAHTFHIGEIRNGFPEGPIIISGFLKRDENGLRIYESFHRAWVGGASILADVANDDHESRAYIQVSGNAEHFFNEKSPPIPGIFSGILVPVDDPSGRVGTMSVRAIEFPPMDSALHEPYKKLVHP